MGKSKKRPLPRRDKWGRFAPRRRNVKFKPYKPPLHDKLGRFAKTRPFPRISGKGKRRPHYRVLQQGEWIEVHAYGYYVVITALVPGGWATDSTPAWITETPTEALHLIIWRTPTRLNLFEASEATTIEETVEEGVNRASGALALAAAMDQEIMILSMELRVLVSPGDSFQVDVWAGIKPPKWLRNER